MSRDAKRRIVCWSENSSHVWTCHDNIPSRMASETLLAWVWYTGAAWRVELSANTGSFEAATLLRARTWVMEQVGGRELEDYD